MHGARVRLYRPLGRPTAPAVLDYDEPSEMPVSV